MAAHAAFSKGALAVITGGASGIGLAAAKALVGHSMHVAIGDVCPDAELQKAQKEVQEAAQDGAKVWAGKVDVSKADDVKRFRDEVKSQFSDAPLQVLMANAGVGGPTKASSWDGFERILGTNLYGVINVNQAFLPDIKSHGNPSLIINTGSKQGITTPPGTGPAYNISKAGVKVFTESLAAELRGDASTKQIEPKLLIPGWVHTGLTGAKEKPEAPAGAWQPEQVIDFLLESLAEGSFYILCPDNETSRETDLKRMKWNIDDVIEDRPALSRWHEEWTDKFNEYMNEN